MESGTTQRRYDTFVMTGDMIIKTTSTKGAPASQLRSPVVVSEEFEVSTNEQVLSSSIHSSQSLLKKSASNGNKNPESKESDADCVFASLANQNACHRYQDTTHIELDIPPDDISSDDERFETDTVEINFDNFPPPPHEFLSKSSESKISGTNILETCIDSPVKSELNLKLNSSGTNIENLSSAVVGAGTGTTLPPLDWRNSLDEAIARLENELPYNSQMPSKSGDFGSEPIAFGTEHGTEDSNGISHGESTDKIQSAKIKSPSSSNSAGRVRSTRSQESCLQFGGDSSNISNFVNIDVVEKSSTSIEVLHLESLSVLSPDGSGRQQHVVPKKTKARVPRQNKMLDSNGSGSPWWEASDANSNANGITRQLQETVITSSNIHMHECYLVCPTVASNDSDTDKNVDNNRSVSINTSSSAKRDYPRKTKNVSRETDIDALPSDLSCTVSPVGNSSETGISGKEEICRSQQLKEVDRPSACRLAKRLYHLDGFRKSDVAKHLSKQNEFSFLVGEEYIRYFDFTGLTLDAALRVFLQRLILSGETQERERILAHFSRRFIECNPRVYNSEDACHTLTCAIMLLNTDLHKQNIGRRMTVSEFIDNLADLNDGENFPRSLLNEIYQSIRNEPFEFELENEETDEIGHKGAGSSPVQQFALGTGSNPFLSVPDASKAVEYKKGFVMRKCCTNPDGRKTPLGRRGWKMWYAVLCDMILYLHKDERSYKNNTSVNSMNNVIHAHHSLASLATDYTKKQHVFCLRTADWSQYLFQTSNSEDCQVWVDTINYAAASLSAPPLPGACGSQNKFQRPLMPSSYTRLSLKDQLIQHEQYLSQIESDLADHVKYPPERGAKSRIIQDYIEKENFLQFEQRRFKTYCQCLHSRMFSSQLPTDLALPLGSNEHTSILESSIGGMKEVGHGSPSRSVDQQTATSKSSALVQRSTSDRHRKQAKRGAGSGAPQQHQLQQKTASGDNTRRTTPRPSSSLQSAKSMPAMLFETRV